MMPASAAPPSFTPGMAVVFLIIAAALVLFVTEPVPIDVTALGVLVALVVLEPWTRVGPVDGVSGFSSPATLTVLAMFVLSEGVRKTGFVNDVARRIAASFGDSPSGQLASVLGLSGLSAGFVNNTPVVAMMIPMVDDISERTGISPSRLLIPVSYASMLGGMLTLVGTSTNILASDVSARLAADYPDLHAFSMFEFTALGAMVLVVGSVYLFLFSPRLIPERVRADEDLIEEFEMADYLTEVTVSGSSRYVGTQVDELFESMDADADVVQVVRDEERLAEPFGYETLEAGDVLVVRTDRGGMRTLVGASGLRVASEGSVGELDRMADDHILVEVIVAPDSNVLGKTLGALDFSQRYDATVLAVRRGGRVIHARMDEMPMRAGDTLLIQATEETVSRLASGRNFVVAQGLERPYRHSKVPLALGIVGGVVSLAALEILPIMTAALSGMVAMVVTGCVRPDELYDSIDWSVVFLLAGLIPLGIAMESTGAADWLASLVVAASQGAPPVAILGLFYLITALVTNVISNNASVVLMIPVAAEAASRIGANTFSFVLAVTFGASTAFLTPIGYQTNLMVYGPGGYRFGDFFRVGAPLQVALTLVTTAGIVLIWGV